MLVLKKSHVFSLLLLMFLEDVLEDESSIISFGSRLHTLGANTVNDPRSDL